MEVLKKEIFKRAIRIDDSPYPKALSFEGGILDIEIPYTNLLRELYPDLPDEYVAQIKDLSESHQTTLHHHIYRGGGAGNYNLQLPAIVEIYEWYCRHCPDDPKNCQRMTERLSHSLYYYLPAPGEYTNMGLRHQVMRGRSRSPKNNWRMYRNLLRN